MPLFRPKKLRRLGCHEPLIHSFRSGRGQTAVFREGNFAGESEIVNENEPVLDAEWDKHRFGGNESRAGITPALFGCLGLRRRQKR